MWMMRLFFSCFLTSPPVPCFHGYSSNSQRFPVNIKHSREFWKLNPKASKPIFALEVLCCNFSQFLGSCIVRICKSRSSLIERACDLSLSRARALWEKKVLIVFLFLVANQIFLSFILSSLHRLSVYLHSTFCLLYSSPLPNSRWVCLFSPVFNYPSRFARVRFFFCVIEDGFWCWFLFSLSCVFFVFEFCVSCFSGFFPSFLFIFCNWFCVFWWFPVLQSPGGFAFALPFFFCVAEDELRCWFSCVFFCFWILFFRCCSAITCACLVVCCGSMFSEVGRFGLIVYVSLLIKICLPLDKFWWVLAQNASALRI